jgi:hypothetical protein
MDVQMNCGQTTNQTHAILSNGTCMLSTKQLKWLLVSEDGRCARRGLSYWCPKMGVARASGVVGKVPSAVQA